jgi:serine/threonine-protein kinase
MTAPEEDSAPVKEGDILAEKYRVERVLGIGGMGAVVAARHLDLDELRALKFMLPKVSADQEAAKRFLREARAAARLKSENVATIHDVGRLEGGEPYMVMEYLDGEDLRTLLKRRGKLPIDEAVDLALQALAGLAEAHAIGIVHRDLKPPNLFVCEGTDGLPRLKILDFGVSKLLSTVEEPEPDRTKTNAMLGSPHYMSPEQMECTRDVDARTDIWSVGVLLYEMLTGDVPFDAPSITALTVMVVNREPVPPRERRPEIAAELEAVVLRCLAKDPDGRYATVADVASDLEPFAPEHGRRLAGHIERVLETVRAREPTPSMVDPEESAPARATRPATPAARSAEPAAAREPRTTASWGGAAPAGAANDRLRRGAMLLACGAVLALLVVVLARPWEDDKPATAPAAEAPAADTPTDSARPSPAESSKADDPSSALPTTSASTKAAPTAPAKKRKRRPDIYDSLEHPEDPYDDPKPRKRRDDPYD